MLKLPGGYREASNSYTVVPPVDSKYLVLVPKLFREPAPSFSFVGALATTPLTTERSEVKEQATPPHPRPVIQLTSALAWIAVAIVGTL